MLSAEAKATLVQQCRLMKSSEHLSLRRDTMVQLTRSKMAELRSSMCSIFVKLGEACKGECLGKAANIYWCYWHVGSAARSTVCLCVGLRL